MNKCIKRNLCRKLKQIGNVSKVPVLGYELSLHLKEVRLKKCKKYKNNINRDNALFTEEIISKTENKKKR